MTKKQYYIPGKEYEWTKETWDTVLKHMGYLADNYGPFATEGENVKGSTSYLVKSGRRKSVYDIPRLSVVWDWWGDESDWTFCVSEEGVEIPEYLIPFYGEKEKEEKMSNRFKFEGAPDDATHYCPEVYGEVNECWVNYTDGEVLFSYGKEFTWEEWSDYEDVEHFFIPRPKKEILTVDDLEVGKEYTMSIKSQGVDEDCLITYWARNKEVVFATNLKYHTYEHFYIEDINHFREVPEVPEKTREQELSEKYNVSLDAIKKMMQDGLIEGEEW